jgi:hypothetical protein
VSRSLCSACADKIGDLVEQEALRVVAIIKEHDQQRYLETLGRAGRLASRRH